jgi:hypothetical protein
MIGFIRRNWLLIGLLLLSYALYRQWEAQQAEETVPAPTLSMQWTMPH